MNDWQLFARERSLYSGNNQQNKPELCDEFIYILAFRNPINRIASMLSEFNREHYYPFQLLIKYDSLVDDKHHDGLINKLQTKYS